ncbi:MAG: hypothetical protein V3S64_00160 [bacterium]
MRPQKKCFSDLLRDTREQAKQSTEVMAILLSMEESEYQALEQGVKLPDNETLKRLCMMMEWNYYDTRRLIANEMAVPNTTAPGVSEARVAEPLLGTESGGGFGNSPTMVALQSISGEESRFNGAKRFDSLGERLRDVRARTGQEVDIIAMLLNIKPDHYRRVESGEQPDGELLKQISIVYDWNYYDLISLLRSENAKELQPRQIGSPFPGGSPLVPRLKSLLGEMEGLFSRIPEKEQEMILSQLELVRETMRRGQQAS